MSLDCVSVEMTGCMVFGSPGAPTTTRPPGTGAWLAATLADGAPDVAGGFPPEHAVATNMAAPKIATSRLITCLPPCVLPVLHAIQAEYVPDDSSVRLGRQPSRSSGAQPLVFGSCVAPSRSSSSARSLSA